MISAILVWCLAALPSHALENGLARTPPMGWCAWNAFGWNSDEASIRDAADAMSSNGMQAAGYEYINFDAGWWQTTGTGAIARNATGYLTWNTAKFPSGLPAVIDYVHKKGFKYGHYTDAGTSACGRHTKNMSEGWEAQDSALFAEWAVDMLKVDACSVVEDNRTLVSRWSQALNATGRPILFSNCHNGCANDPYMKPSAVGWADWCMSEANMWRISSDIQPTWGHVMFNLHTLRGMGVRGGPGHWNDPDFLEVGMGEITHAGPDADRAHFTMWCITSSPLIASPNFVATTQDVIDVLTDRDAIAVNQQYAGNAGDLIDEQGGRIQVCWRKGRCLDAGVGEVWYKPLPDGQAAVALLNTLEKTNGTSVRLNVSFALLPSLGNSPGRCRVYNIWDKSISTMDSEYVATVSPQNVKFLRISNCTTDSGIISVV